ncbi:AP-4 complex subunit beta-1-like isoform X2 [Stegodyphus dumicola]|nr:AP-4 complex subunit beta-1-like isoform X2 [Stegodyphus dumicola]XP_035224830.1 AP-4 complex subunit beta-1-like isoform X2 [Stegodyphus dumicola]XP_035224832.1 AP-4 complex subunit beta-1-like isoform X2 [Stegodyphus dumicola]
MAREIKYVSSMISQLLMGNGETCYAEVSAHLLNLMDRDKDLSPLAGKIIKLLSLPYPPLKRVVCSYLIRYSASIVELNVLAINCFVKDFKDPNPYVRRLVIKTVCRIPCLKDLALQILPQALCDDSSYVRSTAATSSVLVIEKQNLNASQDIIDKLYEMIKDPEPQVICSSLYALEEILQSEGGVIINRRIFLYLVSRISDFQDWNFAVVCIVLKKHIPESEEELLYFLNAVDERLLHSNPAIFVTAADIALYYANHLEKNFSVDILKQISPQLKLLLSSSNAELLSAILDIIESYLPNHREIFSSFYNLFFCYFHDSVTVKVKKLCILVHLVNKSNISAIAEELLLYCSDCNKEISSQAVHSFVFTLKKHSVGNPMKKFISLIDIEFNTLNEEILKAVCSLDFHELIDLKNEVMHVVSECSLNIVSFDAKLSLLKLLVRYGNEITRSPYIIEQFVNDPVNLEDENIMTLLLTASVKLFLHHPQKMQLLLGYILQHAKTSNNLSLKKLGSIYHYFLNNCSIAQKIIGS